MNKLFSILFALAMFAPLSDAAITTTINGQAGAVTINATGGVSTTTTNGVITISGTGIVTTGSYSAGTTYTINGTAIGSDGNIYRALTTTTGINPVTSATNWELFSVLTSTTLSVPSRFATVPAALSFYANTIVSPSAFVQVQLASGTYSITGSTGWNFNHPYGAQVKFIGDTATPANVVLSATGMSGYSADSLLYPVAGAVFVNNGHTLGFMDGFKLLGSGSLGINGILAYNGSTITTGSNIVLSGFYRNVSSMLGSSIICEGVTANGGSYANFEIYGSSFMDMQKAVSGSATIYAGVFCDQGSSVQALLSTSTNNIVGVWLKENSTADVRSAVISGTGTQKGIQITDASSALTTSATFPGITGSNQIVRDDGVTALLTGTSALTLTGSVGSVTLSLAPSNISITSLSGAGTMATVNSGTGSGQGAVFGSGGSLTFGGDIFAGGSNASVQHTLTNNSTAGTLDLKNLSTAGITALGILDSTGSGRGMLGFGNSGVTGWYGGRYSMAATASPTSTASPDIVVTQEGTYPSASFATYPRILLTGSNGNADFFGLISGKYNFNTGDVNSDAISRLHIEGDRGITGLVTNVAPIFTGTGTVTQSGFTVTGVGTSFITQTPIGTKIAPTGKTSEYVVEVTSDTVVKVDQSQTISSGTTYQYYQASFAALNNIGQSRDNRVAITQGNDLIVAGDTSARIFFGVKGANMWYWNAGGGAMTLHNTFGNSDPILIDASTPNNTMWPKANGDVQFNAGNVVITVAGKGVTLANGDTLISGTYTGALKSTGLLSGSSVKTGTNGTARVLALTATGSLVFSAIANGGTVTGTATMTAPGVVTTNSPAVSISCQTAIPTGLVFQRAWVLTNGTIAAEYMNTMTITTSSTATVVTSYNYEGP